MIKIKQFSLNILRKRPVTIATISCGVFGIGGDLLCQRLEWNWYTNKNLTENNEKTEKTVKNTTNNAKTQDTSDNALTSKPPISYDLTRTAKFALNASLYGPFNYYWYRFLDRRYPTRNPKDMAKKILIDLGFALVYYPIWFTTYSIIDTGKFEPMKLKKDMTEKIPVLLSIDIVLWPILQYANFRYLGPEFRVIGTKCSELVFDVIMSYILNNHITMETMLKDGEEWWNGDENKDEMKSEIILEIAEKPVKGETPKNE